MMQWVNGVKLSCLVTYVQTTQKYAYLGIGLIKTEELCFEIVT